MQCCTIACHCLVWYSFLFLNVSWDHFESVCTCRSFDLGTCCSTLRVVISKAVLPMVARVVGIDIWLVGKQGLQEMPLRAAR